MKNIRISTSIILIAVLPMLLAAFFAGKLLYGEMIISSEMKQLSTLTDLSVKMSTLVHEQQKERGATAVFVGSNGADFKTEMLAQRAETDKKHAELKAYLDTFNAASFDETFNKGYNEWLAMLGKLPSIRASVDELSISKKDTIAYFTNLNKLNLDLIAYMANLSSDPIVVTRLVSYVNFMQGKERAGVERATGSAGFASGQFAPEALDTFKEMITAQQTYGEIFLSYATDTQKELYQQVMEADAAMKVKNMRKIAIDTNGGLSAVMEVNGGEWFHAITEKINGLKTIEDTLAKDLQQTMQQRMEAVEKHLTESKTIAVSALVLISLLCIVVVRGINRSFAGMVNAMSRLAEGDTSVDIPAVGRTNEIGKMAATVQVFKENAIERDRMREEQKKAEERAQQEKRDMMNKLADGFKERVLGVIQTVASASTQLSHTAQHMTGLIEQSSKMAQDAVASATQTTANVQSVATAAEEMSATVREISVQVQRANDLVSQSVRMIEGTDSHVQNLSKASNSVKEVVRLISDIAGQINLLALNATIESARAGEAGKGFAVVAGEIKGLASQTDKSIQEIEEVIENMGEASSNIITSLGGIKESVANISATSGGVASAVEEQSATTNEIASNMQSAAQGTQLISGNLQEISHGASESQSASEQVLGAAQELSRQAEVLEQAVETFLIEIRAA